MKKICYYCDICGREVSPKDKYRIKVQSRAFVNYANQEDMFADRRKWDICRDCLDEIGKKVRNSEKI